MLGKVRSHKFHLGLPLCYFINPLVKENLEIFLFLPVFYSGNEKYGFIVSNDDFTSKKLTTKLMQQIQVRDRLYSVLDHQKGL